MFYFFFWFFVRLFFFSSSESVQFDKTMFPKLIRLTFFTRFTLEISSMSRTTTVTKATAPKFTNYSRRRKQFTADKKIIPIRILLHDVVVDDDDGSAIWPMDLDSETEIREFLSNLNATERTF